MLSLTIAGIVLRRDRLVGIGQAITMPNWLQAISAINPLRYEIDALRGLIIGTPYDLPLDLAVLVVACTLGIAVSARLLRRLAQ